MDIETFNKTRFGGNMVASIGGEVRYIISVNFKEALFGLLDEDLIDSNGDFDGWDVDWVRCERVDSVRVRSAPTPQGE